MRDAVLEQLDQCTMEDTLYTIRGNPAICQRWNPELYELCSKVDITDAGMVQVVSGILQEYREVATRYRSLTQHMRAPPE